MLLSESFPATIQRHRYTSPASSLRRTHKQTLIAAIGTCRNACVKARRKADYDSDIYKRLDRLMTTIDDVAESLTGDVEHFWLKPNGDVR